MPAVNCPVHNAADWPDSFPTPQKIKPCRRGSPTLADIFHWLTCQALSPLSRRSGADSTSSVYRSDIGRRVNARLQVVDGELMQDKNIHGMVSVNRHLPGWSG